MSGPSSKPGAQLGSKPEVVVVGGGLGGLWATLSIAEAGFPVRLFALFEVKRSHSVCAQGGINAVMDRKGERDTVAQHIADTLKGGDWLANQPPVKSLCEEAPGLIRTFERMGVTFSRTPEGRIDQRLFGGVKNKRACFAGASTGQQLLYGVDQQVRRLESEGRVTKHEFWELLSLVLDDSGTCRGIVAMDLKSLAVRAFPAAAVVVATGGFGQIYAPHTTTSTNSTGAAASRCFQQGAWLANPELFQFHPTAMIGRDKNRLMSEAARGEGGRVWVPRTSGDRRPPRAIPEGERWYFLEDFFPAYGNTVARDEAARAIWRVTRELKLGIGGGDRVYLDLTHLDRAFVAGRLGAILDIYRKFAGVDPLAEPMEIFPAAHYAMGGLWVDFERDAATGGMRPGSPSNHATNVPGLFACGECDYAYHGANRLGANSLLSASFSGRTAGESVTAWLKGRDGSAAPDGAWAEAEVRRQEGINGALMAADGGENPYRLHRELGELMTDRVGVVRDNAGLTAALDGLADLLARCDRVTLGEASPWANQTLAFARQVKDMIVLAQAVTAGALARDECRGAHWKPAFAIPKPDARDPAAPSPADYLARWQANNARWLKTTLVRHTPDGCEIDWQGVDTSVLPPREPRDYR